MDKTAKSTLVLCSVLLIPVMLCYLFKDTLLLAMTVGRAVKLNSPAEVNAWPAPPDIDIDVSEVVTSGFIRAVQVTHAGDGSQRLFVVEQIGRIHIIKNGAVLPTPFLDISHLIACCAEQGLLGLAFHPDYEHNGYFYLNYTRQSDWVTMIARYTVSTDPDQADPDSALTLLTVSDPFSTHNGGQLAFSPVDGYLYIGLGDGGRQGDPNKRAQNKDTLLGKILRLDVNGHLPDLIPPDNPYVGRAGADEIWAIGLRNPWRFSFDRATGDLYIGDVGQDSWEEIDYQAARTSGGLNFGWRCREGKHAYKFVADCNSANLTGPIAEYPHDLGNAVTGGFVYRGKRYPALVGYYFYADFVSGRIWSIRRTGPGIWSTPQEELSVKFHISSFGEDETGELYLVEYAVDPTGGRIHRLTGINGSDPGLANITPLPASSAAGEGLNFPPLRGD